VSPGESGGSGAGGHLGEGIGGVGGAGLLGFEVLPGGAGGAASAGQALEELRTESEAYQLQWRQNEISELRAGHAARLVAIEEANALLRDQQCQVVVLNVLCCMPSLRLCGTNARSTPTVPRSEVRLRRHCRWPRKRS
jgi:hypothetical protein